MGACSSGEEIEGKTRRMQQERISGSKMVELHYHFPRKDDSKTWSALEARELETVLVVLGRVAVNQDGKLLQMVFSEHVVPHDSTVQAAGLRNGSRFEVSLQAINILKMRKTVLTDEECVAAQLDPGAITLHWGEWTNGVSLICNYAPERVNTDKDEVTAHCSHA